MKFLFRISKIYMMRLKVIMSDAKGIHQTNTQSQIAALTADEKEAV